MKQVLLDGPGSKDYVDYDSQGIVCFFGRGFV